jgi:hypothetical protein
MYDLGDRAKFFGLSAMLGEAGAGKHELGSAPHVWMASDTHFRPWFNVSGCQDQIGYGAAQDRDGKWYFIAVAIVDQDPDCVNATVAPTAEPTAATTAEPTAEATAEPTAEPTTEATAEEPSPAPAQADRFPLLPGQTVEREQKIPSESGNHYLIFQPDSNVVVYTADDQYVWGLQSITDAYTRTQSVQVENDGNFVVRDANGEHIWSALTENPDASAYLTLTPEGVLRLVSGDSGATLWASDGDLSPVAPTAEPTVAATDEPTGEEAGESTPEATVEPAAEATPKRRPNRLARRLPNRRPNRPTTLQPKPRPKRLTKRLPNQQARTPTARAPSRRPPSPTAMAMSTPPCRLATSCGWRKTCAPPRAATAPPFPWSATKMPG